MNIVCSDDSSVVFQLYCGLPHNCTIDRLKFFKNRSFMSLCWIIIPKIISALRLSMIFIAEQCTVAAPNAISSSTSPYWWVSTLRISRILIVRIFFQKIFLGWIFIIQKANRPPFVDKIAFLVNESKHIYASFKKSLTTKS